METKLIKVGKDNLEQAAASAAAVLKSGGLVGLPTETVYGLAANIYDEAAVKKIFEVKGRPQDNPIIVHISDFVMLRCVAARISDQAVELAKRFWPGPLTMVLDKTAEVSDTVSCGLSTVGVRMPSHPVAAAVIEAAGVPLAAPSANLSGRPSTTTAQHVMDDIGGRIPLILDGGPCEVGVESTVVSLCGEHPVLLRPGIISLEQIREVLPDAELAAAVLEGVKEGERVLSPGLKYKHYSPEADVMVVKGSLEQFIKYSSGFAGRRGCFAMCFDGEQDKIIIPSVSYGVAHDANSQAKRLFTVLRMLDKAGAAQVLVRSPEEQGTSMAVFNRLIRAAGFKVVKL